MYREREHNAVDRELDACTADQCCYAYPEFTEYLLALVDVLELTDVPTAGSALVQAAAACSGTTRVADHAVEDLIIIACVVV